MGGLKGVGVWAGAGYLTSAGGGASGLKKDHTPCSRGGRGEVGD